MLPRRRIAAVLLLSAFICGASANAQSRLLPQKSNVLLDAPTEPGVTLDAKQFLHWSDLRAACIAVAPKVCHVTVSEPMQLHFAGTAYVPTNMHVRFMDDGRWQIEGGSTLDFSGGSVEAPADRWIFGGSGRVVGLNEARPDWFGNAKVAEGRWTAEKAATRPDWFGNPTGPPVSASLMVAAYEATVTGGTIRLNARAYMSPFTALAQSISALGVGPDVVQYTSPRTFIGAGRPLPDNETAPTRLVRGTVIVGQVVGSAPIVVEHLGIDDGPFVAKNEFGGFKGHGLAMFGTGRLEGTGTRIEDVSVLTGAGESTHSVMVEGQRDATIHGLWIWSLGGLHGLVLKSSHSTVGDFHCKGSAGDCLIVKSDYATSRAGRATDDTLSNIFISYLAKPGDTGGIVIDSTWDTVRDVRISDVHLDGLSYGLEGTGSLFFKLRNLRLDHWQARGMLGRCVDMVGFDGVDVSNIDCALAPVPLAEAFRFDGAHLRLADIDVRCDGSPAVCAAAGSAGITLLSKSAEIARIHGAQLGGQLISRTTPHRSVGERLRSVKPPLRIAYTWTMTRVREHRLVAACCVLMLFAGVLAMFRKNRFLSR